MAKPQRKVILVLTVGAALVLLGSVVWIGWNVTYTVNRIPEAYAAWDTGTLLVEYMKGHQDRWPRSWDDLLTVMDTDAGRQVLLRGASAGDMQYARSLRDRVAVDWSFDPQHPDRQTPVTRPSAGAFHVVWQGAEPNEIIRAYLMDRAATRPSAAR